MLRARLLGGQLSKARRGELQMGLPVGLVYGTDGQVVRDPDQQVQGALRLLFATFRRTGSAFKTVKSFRLQGVAFPSRLRKGPHKGEVVWGPWATPKRCTCSTIPASPVPSCTGAGAAARPPMAEST